MAALSINPRPDHFLLLKPTQALISEDGHTRPGIALTFSHSEETLVANEDKARVERPLGETEVSYFLPSRDSGVNDMYLHLGLRSPTGFFKHSFVCLMWAILRLRHPLLASRVEMTNYRDINFVYNLPYNIEDALRDAASSLDFKTQNKDGLIDEYLNGPRTLSNDRLSFLIISQDKIEHGEVDSGEQNYDLMICAAHFLGDGMALHRFANELFGLVGGAYSHSELTKILEDEIRVRRENEINGASLPPAMEDVLEQVNGKFHRAASLVEYQLSQQKLIGGHTFPRKSHLPRNTVVPTVSFDVETSKNILRNCKARDISVSSALFAVCNIAWAKMCSDNVELPMMMYSALNMRPHILANKSLHDSYWFLAIGYFNVILPSFIPRTSSEDLEKCFWHRAKSAKLQSYKAAKSPMLISRTHQMALERGQRARIWAKQDDNKSPKRPPVAKPKQQASTKPPSNALLGLSLLGNLDAIYRHDKYENIKLHTLTTGSRQRQGGYDENGFEEGVVETFWQHVLDTINQFLL